MKKYLYATLAVLMLVCLVMDANTFIVFRQTDHSVGVVVFSMILCSLALASFCAQIWLAISEEVEKENQ